MNTNEMFFICQKQTRGTFFEAGAYDGEHTSNTLWLELNHGWTGMLVEPIRKEYEQALLTKRTAVFLNACISPYNLQSKVTKIYILDI